MTKFNKRLALLGLAMTFSLPASSAGLSLSEIQSLDRNNTGAEFYRGMLDETASLRMKTLKSTALSIGAQHGYVHRSKELVEIFNEHSDILDIFDFNVIMKMSSFGEEQMFFIPPVIVEANNVMAVSPDSQTVRVSGKLYDIKEPAKLSLRPPHWRQYLTIHEDLKPNLPNKALLPKNNEERANWQVWVLEGWNAGITQADDEMKIKIAKLGEDFTGMVRYMRLVDEGKIREPNISTLKQNVVNNGSSMSQEEAVYQLSIPAIFNSDIDDWNALHGDSRSSFLMPQEIPSYD